MKPTEKNKIESAKRIASALFLSAVVMSFPLSSQASFKAQPNSVRAIGMGGAFMGIGNEAAGLFINPAALATLPRPELGFTYSQLYAGVDDINFGLGSASLGLP